MRYTKYNSMNQILSYPNMRKYLEVFYSEYLLDMFPKEYENEPLALAEQFGKTPWGDPFPVVVDQLIDAVNLIADICENKSRRCISLWNPSEDWTLEKNTKDGKEGVFLVAPNEKRDSEQRPAAIICPGGGYEAVCFSGEGTPMMHYMEAQGYRAFILKYRVAPAVYPAPQEDLAEAIRYVRSHAEEYGVNPEQVVTIGFSAGGHLCASEAALYEGEARPDKVCVGYPVISFVQEPHEGSAENLTGGKRKLREQLSVENMVTEAYPPTFVWTCGDDDCVPPSNAMRMGEALEAAGVPYELHVYPSGNRGCALAFSKSAYTWSRSMIEFMRKDFSGTQPG